VIGGEVSTGCDDGDDAEPEPLSVGGGVVAGGAVAAGELTDGVEEVLPFAVVARSPKYSEKAATSANPTPASQRVVDEIRRMPLSRSTFRCGATRPLLSGGVGRGAARSSQPSDPRDGELTPGKNHARIATGLNAGHWAASGPSA
jgi:hypothetical protein